MRTDTPGRCRQILWRNFQASFDSVNHAQGRPGCPGISRMALGSSQHLDCAMTLKLSKLIAPPKLAHRQLCYTTRRGAAYCGDSLKLLAADDSINLVVTNPPFALQRKKEYGNKDQSESASNKGWPRS